MSQLHMIAATLAIAIVVLGLVGVVVVALRREWARHAGRGLAVVGGALVIAAATGAGMFVASGPPADPLHVVYGLVALGIVYGAAIVRRGRPPERRGLPTLVAALFLVGVAIRLAQTGG